MCGLMLFSLLRALPRGSCIGGAMRRHAWHPLGQFLGPNEVTCWPKAFLEAENWLTSIIMISQGSIPAIISQWGIVGFETSSTCVHANVEPFWSVCLDHAFWSLRYLKVWLGAVTGGLSRHGNRTCEQGRQNPGCLYFGGVILPNDTGIETSNEIKIPSNYITNVSWHVPRSCFHCSCGRVSEIELP